MKPESHEEIPVTLDEAVEVTGLAVGDVLRLAIETGLRVMESARQN